MTKPHITCARRLLTVIGAMLISALFACAQQTTSPQGQKSQDLMRQMDTDKDQQVSKEEYMSSRTASKQNTPAPAMPSPTPMKAVPVSCGRPSRVSHPSAQANVATSVHALSTPATKRSNVHIGSDDVQPTAAVTTTVLTRPSRRSVDGVNRTRAATAAPIRYPR